MIAICRRSPPGRDDRRADLPRIMLIEKAAVEVAAMTTTSTATFMIHVGC
jgi:hypothetical protein